MDVPPPRQLPAPRRAPRWGQRGVRTCAVLSLVVPLALLVGHGVLVVADVVLPAWVVGAAMLGVTGLLALVAGRRRSVLDTPRTGPGGASFWAVVLLALGVCALLAVSAVLLVVGAVAPGSLARNAVVVALAVGTVVAVVVLGLRRRRRTRPGDSDAGRRTPLEGRAARAWLGTSIGCSAALVLGGALWDGVFGVHHVVLTPRGPGGCAVAVAESSFTVAGGGTVFLVRPHSVIGRRAGTYGTDDGYRAVEAGAYQLLWSGTSGSLVVTGAVSEDIASLDCS